MAVMTLESLVLRGNRVASGKLASVGNMPAMDKTPASYPYQPQRTPPAFGQRPAGNPVPRCFARIARQAAPGKA